MIREEFPASKSRPAGATHFINGHPAGCRQGGFPTIRVRLLLA